MAAKKRRAIDEDEIVPLDPEDADVDVLMASPEHHLMGSLLQDGDELLASNAAQAVGMDEASKRPHHIPTPMPPPVQEAESAPKKKKNEWVRKAGDLQLPMQRTRRILKSDKDIKMVNLAAVVVISKAAEMFLDTLIHEAYKRTATEKRKTVQYKDVAGAIAEIDAMEFLTDSIPLNERRFAVAPGGPPPKSSH